MRSLIHFSSFAMKRCDLYPREFLVCIIFRPVQETQFPSILLLELRLVILPILQQHVRASRAGHITQVGASIKPGALSLLKGISERVDSGAADRAPHDDKGMQITVNASSENFEGLCCKRMRLISPPYPSPSSTALS